ncbi:MAG: ankyrin repeat domain-containing protein [Burkholderiaceae bacterium]
MDRTGYKQPSSYPKHQNFFSDDFNEVSERQEGAQDFQSQLTSIICSRQADALEQLVQEQPAAWSLIRPDELGKYLLVAVKKGRLDMVAALVSKSAPGTADAISLDMQLELVEAARLERNDEPEMSRLLDVLLQAVDCPVQYLERLNQKAVNEKNFSVATALFTYKDNFVKARNGQSLQSIHDAAAAGDAARLQKELDAKLGIPPLDDNLTGTAWLFNMLHRWVAEFFTTGAAKTLVNEKMGELPLLHVAVQSGNKNTVFLLIQKGAEMSTVDSNGDTALSKARKQNHGDIVALLERLGATDRIDALVLTQSGSSQRKIAGQTLPQHKDRTGEPSYSDTVASFKTLLPDVASALSNSKDLAGELNGAEAMSVEQAGLFTVSYLAEFEPPQAVDGQRSRKSPVTRPDGVLSQLQANRDSFRAEGLRLEASKAKEIRAELDSLASITFAVVWTSPSDMQQRLQNAGLCNLLITCVVQAVQVSRGNSGWASVTDERRKEIFTTCLSSELSGLSTRRSAVEKEGADQERYKQLLRRQVSLLEAYCKPIGGVHTTHAKHETDFSNYIW